MHDNVSNCMNTYKMLPFYSLTSEIDIYFLSWEVMANSDDWDWARPCFWKAQGNSGQSEERQLPSEAACHFAGGSLDALHWITEICVRKKRLSSPMGMAIK